MIRVEGLTKSFPSKGGVKTIFKDVSFILENNKSLAILGGPSCGKSLLLQVIGRIDFPSSGKVRSSNKISWIMNQVKFEDSMSLRQNVRFFCRLAGVRDFDRIERFVTDNLALGDNFNKSVKGVTGPEKKSVALATTMAIDFDTYLLDGTPYQGVKNNIEFWKECLLEKKATSNFIIAGPSLPIARDFCDVALVLNEGQAHYYDDLEEGIEVFKKLDL